MSSESLNFDKFYSKVFDRGAPLNVTTFNFDRTKVDGQFFPEQNDNIFIEVDTDPPVAQQFECQLYVDFYFCGCVVIAHTGVNKHTIIGKEICPHSRRGENVINILEEKY